MAASELRKLVVYIFAFVQCRSIFSFPIYPSSTSIWLQQLDDEIIRIGPDDGSNQVMLDDGSSSLHDHNVLGRKKSSVITSSSDSLARIKCSQCRKVIISGAPLLCSSSSLRRGTGHSERSGHWAGPLSGQSGQ